MTEPAWKARGQVLGVPVTVVTEAALLAAIARAVDTRTPTVFVGLYASLYRTLARDPAYRARVADGVTYPDGFGVVAELHKRGIPEAERLATTDMVHPIAALAAARGWRVGLYGGAPGIAERAAAVISANSAGIEIVGVWDGYTGGPSAEQLQDAGIDVLFVGLGAPRQEAWAHEVGTPAGVAAVLTCGGLFDFLAGNKRRAPHWVQRIGLEWVFRIMLEPRRLIGRYLLGNSYFLWHARTERRRTA